MILLIMVAAVAGDAAAQGRYAWRDVQSVEAAKPVNNPRNMVEVNAHNCLFTGKFVVFDSHFCLIFKKLIFLYFRAPKLYKDFQLTNYFFNNLCE